MDQVNLKQRHASSTPLKHLLLSAVFCALSFIAQATPDERLPRAHYDLAECAFGHYMSTNATPVYHLAYCAQTLPAEFMARFKAKRPLIRSKPDGITVISNKFVLDKPTGKKAIGLDIREIQITGDAAEVQMVYFASHTSHSARLSLVREHGKWRVKERKLEWIACG